MTGEVDARCRKERLSLCWGTGTVAGRTRRVSKGTKVKVAFDGQRLDEEWLEVIDDPGMVDGD